MAKPKEYMAAYRAAGGGVVAPVVDSARPANRNRGRREKVTWNDLSPQERRQIDSDYLYQYARGLFQDGKTGYLYQSNHLYLIRSRGYDGFELISRWELI